MAYSATITSKRQLTIPVKVFRSLGFEVGDRVVITEEDGALKIKRAVDLVEKLAGSVKIPDELKGVDVDEAIRIAKERRFGGGE